MPKLNHKYNLSNSNDVKEIINGCLKKDKKYQKILFENVYISKRKAHSSRSVGGM